MYLDTLYGSATEAILLRICIVHKFLKMEQQVQRNLNALRMCLRENVSSLSQSKEKTHRTSLRLCLFISQAPNNHNIYIHNDHVFTKRKLIGIINQWHLGADKNGSRVLPERIP